VICGRQEDWFLVRLNSGDTVQAVSDADPLGSFDLQLTDSAGTVLEENPAAVHRVVGSTGAFFLRMRTNDAAAFYGLRVQVARGASCAHNPPQPHPNAQAALPLPLGPTYAWSVCPGEATWFSIGAAVGLGADVMAAVDPRDGPIALQLFDSDAITLLAQDLRGSAAPRVAAASSRGGTFFLRVAGTDELVGNRYDLTARVVPP
jgi:hypothetical protein